MPGFQCVLVGVAKLLLLQQVRKTDPGRIWSRGLMKAGALVQDLKSRYVGGAGVDVYDQEPPPADHPLLTVRTGGADSPLREL